MARKQLAHRLCELSLLAGVVEADRSVHVQVRRKLLHVGRRLALVFIVNIHLKRLKTNSPSRSFWHAPPASCWGMHALPSSGQLCVLAFDNVVAESSSRTIALLGTVEAAGRREHRCSHRGTIASGPCVQVVASTSSQSTHHVTAACFPNADIVWPTPVLGVTVALKVVCALIETVPRRARRVCQQTQTRDGGGKIEDGLTRMARPWRPLWLRMRR